MKKKRELFGPEFAKVRRLAFHSYKMHFCIIYVLDFDNHLIALTFKLSAEFLRHTFHL